MIQYRGNPETIHFVNWVLHSGHVDLADLIHKAGEVVKKEHKGEGEISLGQFNEYMTEPLQCLLEEVLAQLAETFAPEFLYYEDEYVEAACHYSEKTYREVDAHRMLAPLFRSAIDRIDLEKAALHIITQTMLPAKMSA